MGKWFKEDLFFYFKNFSMYDYLAYGWAGLVVFLFLIVSLILFFKGRNKSGLFFFLMFFVFIFASPFVFKYIFQKYVRKNEITISKSSKLIFSKSLIVDGALKNISKIDFKTCKIDIFIVKPSANPIKQFINTLKPTYVKSQIIKNPVLQGDEINFRVIFDDFTLEDFNTTVKGACY